MTMHKSEMLSMLVDGECDADKTASILRQIGQADDLKTRWHGYHLIGDALRHSLPDRIDTHFSSRVALALESEPAYLLPGHSSGATEHKPTTQPNQQPPVTAPIKEHTRFRFGAAAGFAMAASLSAIAVFNLGQTEAPFSNNTSNNTPIVTAKAEQPLIQSNAVPLGNTAFSDHAALVSAPTVGRSGNVFVSSPGVRPMLTTLGGVSTVAQYDDGTSMSYPTEAADLYDYLVNYGRYSAGAGQNDMLAHISLATYENVR